MTTTRTRLYAGAAVGLALAAAVGFGAARLSAPTASPVAEQAQAKEAEPDKPKDAVAMSPAAAAKADIQTTLVAAGGLDAEILSQAVVAAAPDGQAVLTAHAAGAVSRIFKRLGDPVRAGETVALVESREAGAIAADRSVAAAKATLAGKRLARERRLYELRVSPRQDFEAAEASAAEAAAEVRRAQAQASAARVTGDGRSVAVASPISGRITAAPASLGAYVQAETELFRVADPRRIQIEAQVTAADAQRIAPGDRAFIETAEGPLATAVRAVAPALDLETRSATVVLSLAGSGAALQPGQLVRVRILPRGAGSSAIVVPDEAVQSIQGRDAVFVRTSAGFQVRPVNLGRRSAGRVEIASGLESGEAVATRNAFLLKAELGKSGEEE